MFTKSEIQGRGGEDSRTQESGETVEPQRESRPVQAAPDMKTVRRRVRWAGGLLLALFFLLYLTTLDNGLQPYELGGGDLITHQYAQVQARPSNAPGYPLYTMGGWIWFHGLRGLLHAVGVEQPNPIPLLSSYSLIWALAAVALLYAILCHVTRSPRHPAGNWPLAWLLTGFYGVTYFFWYYATTTEQYSSAIAQTLAIIYVYFLWRAAGTPRRQDRLLVLLAFLCGLSLAHMLTVAFIVPPLVAAILWEQPRLLRRPGLILTVFAAALAPLAAYSYVYLRGAAHPEWWGEGDWQSAGEWFWAFVSTAQGREELLWGFQPTCKLFDNGFPGLIWQELSPLMVLLGLVGLALLPRRPSVVLYATLIIYLIFNWMYRCGNWYQVILPAYPILVLGAGLLLDRWEQHLAASREPGTQSGHWRRWSPFLPALLALALLAWRLQTSWGPADSRNRTEDTGLDRAGILLDQPLPPDAGLFAPVDDALALDYLVNIWQIRADLDVVSSIEAGRRLQNGVEVLTTFAAAPVLLAELPPELAPYRQSIGPDWLRLHGSLQPADRPAIQTEIDILPGVTLQGYTVHAAPTGAPVTTAPPAADVTLYWQVADEWPAGLGWSLRPTRAGQFMPDPAAADGTMVQVDGGAPLRGLYSPGLAAQPVADGWRIPLPPESDGLVLLVYLQDGEGFRNLLELPLDGLGAATGRDGDG